MPRGPGPPGPSLALTRTWPAFVHRAASNARSRPARLRAVSTLVPDARRPADVLGAVPSETPLPRRAMAQAARALGAAVPSSPCVQWSHADANPLPRARRASRPGRAEGRPAAARAMATVSLGAPRFTERAEDGPTARDLDPRQHGPQARQPRSPWCAPRPASSTGAARTPGPEHDQDGWPGRAPRRRSPGGGPARRTCRCLSTARGSAAAPASARSPRRPRARPAAARAGRRWRAGSARRRRRRHRSS